MKYVLLLLLLSFAAYGQNISIPGQVVDGNNNPIGLANISVVGENSVATTDDSGMFLLKLQSKYKKGDIITIRVSKIGYLISTRHIAVSPIVVSIALKKDKAVKIAHLATLENKQKTEPVVIPQQPINVTSYDQKGGITAGQVIVGSPPRILNGTDMAELISQLPKKEEKINITSLVNDGEGYRYAKQIFDFLKTNGYQNINIYQVMVFGSRQGQKMSRDTAGVKIEIGSDQ